MELFRAGLFVRQGFIELAANGADKVSWQLQSLVVRNDGVLDERDWQIESIQFGNWFSIMRTFIPEESVFELIKPYRTNNEALLDFWSKVRHLDDGIEESIAQNNYSTVRPTAPDGLRY
ncbi:Uncharacterised protein [Mycobacteroides abscessus subsp. bolletii]|nr:Uncharacterised protein [Mycobacteroides abscessus subsp. bolletii]SII61719.1 Uncharacterised protein [Mycobacteroides abscessus subsp. bolletii]SKS40123.1 Uncharacterised protein [Mycobacteroides abscessus subsp. bolletii]SKT48158.1 Uncharacterised protein [Mycobacteroides abscessus subsp. bolletii]SLD76241.1 Uncharacterised protein [Mycobacteroides abscessus subsp. bolletii]